MLVRYAWAYRTFESYFLFTSGYLRPVFVVSLGNIIPALWHVYQYVVSTPSFPFVSRELILLSRFSRLLPNRCRSNFLLFRKASKLRSQGLSLSYKIERKLGKIVNFTTVEKRFDVERIQDKGKVFPAFLGNPGVVAKIAFHFRGSRQSGTSQGRLTNFGRGERWGNCCFADPPPPSPVSS